MPYSMVKAFLAFKKPEEDLVLIENEKSCTTLMETFILYKVLSTCCFCNFLAKSLVYLEPHL